MELMFVKQLEKCLAHDVSPKVSSFIVTAPCWIVTRTSRAGPAPWVSPCAVTQGPILRRAHARFNSLLPYLGILSHFWTRDPTLTEFALGPLTRLLGLLLRWAGLLSTRSPCVYAALDKQHSQCPHLGTTGVNSWETYRTVMCQRRLAPASSQKWYLLLSTSPGWSRWPNISLLLLYMHFLLTITRNFSGQLIVYCKYRIKSWNSSGKIKICLQGWKITS